MRYLYNRRRAFRPTWTANNEKLNLYDDSLLGAWYMDEQSGNRADSKGSNDLIDGSSVGYVNDGTFGDVADLELSSTDYFTLDEVSRNAATMFYNQWVNFESLGTTERIFEDYTDAGNSRFTILANTSSQLLVAMRDTSAGSALLGTSTNTFSPSTWYNVSVFVDTVNNKIYGYVNDVEWIDASQTMGNFYDAAAAYDARMGANYNGSVHSQYVDGLLYNCNMWKDITFGDAAARTSFVSALYNSGSGSKYIG